MALACVSDKRAEAKRLWLPQVINFDSIGFIYSAGAVDTAAAAAAEPSEGTAVPLISWDQLPSPQPQLAFTSEFAPPDSVEADMKLLESSE